MEGARVRRNRTRAVITTAAALSATAALAVPAGAAPPPPPGHTLISFTQRDFVSDQGFSLSDGPVIVNVIRNGAIIATSTPVTPADDPKTTGVFDGLVEVNHPGGGCWVTSTPDILPGDTIRMTTKSGTGFSEDTTTANVTAEPAELGAGSTVVVHGTAQAAAGGPLPIDQIEQRIVANKQAFDANGRRTLRADSTGTADGTLSYDPVGPANPDGINWTATYTRLSAGDLTLATTNETRALWLGADPALTNEGTIYETSLDGSIVPGPATPDCTAPLAQSAIGSTAIDNVPATLINQSNVGGNLVISGPYDPVNVNGVTVTIPGVNVPPAVLNAGSWTVTLPAASLPEGTVKITAAFTPTPVTPAAPPKAAFGGGGAPNSTATIVKDTVAPDAPTANLGTGPYAGAQTIILQAAPGTTIRFTGDGSTPTATSGAVFTSPFSVTSTQTIRAVAVDNHGNASLPSSFTYTIGAAIAANPAGVIPGIGANPATRQQLAGKVQVQGKVVASPLSVSRLTLAKRISIKRLRVQGLRTSMQVQQGTKVVQIAIYKARGGQRTGRALFTTIRVPKKAGLFRVTLRSSKLSKLRPGQYVMQVRAGRSAASLSSPRQVLFTLTK